MNETSYETPANVNGIHSYQETPQEPESQQQPQSIATGASNIATFQTPTSNYPHDIPQQSSPSTGVSTSVSVLETRLAEANAKIAALTKELETKRGSGIRQRNVNSTSLSTSNVSPGRPLSSREVVQTATEQGVPIKIVAYLCLAAFLLAYLFF